MGEIIESAVLAQVTERERVSVRIFQTLNNVAVVNSFNTYLTGNNINAGGDNTRRILVGRVDPKVENPLDRKFEKLNPVLRVFEDRGKYVHSCLTIVRAYIAAGRPNKLNPTPSYAAWDELVREPLVWLGLADPTDSMRASFDDDPANAAHATLMAAWPPSQTGWTCAELIDAAMQMNGNEPAHSGLAEALRPIARDRRGIFDTDVLGKHLRRNRDTIVGGRKISRHPMKAHGNVTRWMLVKG